jgi:hypothetical protein
MRATVGKPDGPGGRRELALQWFEYVPNETDADDVRL